MAAPRIVGRLNPACSHAAADSVSEVDQAVPYVTIMQNTKNSETVELGANVVVGAKPEGMVKSAFMMIDRKREWPNPFGDGHTAEGIVRILEEKQG